MKKEYHTPTLACNRVRTHEVICTSTITGGGTAEDGNAQARPRGASDWDQFEQ